MKQMQQIANILRSPYRLIAMPTKRYNAVVALLDEFCLQSGQPIYLWRKESALQRLGEQFPITNTTNPLDLIEFIRNSVHFGVYLLLDFPIKKGSRLSVELKHVLLNQNAKARILLLGTDIAIEQSLMPLTLMVDCSHEQETQQQAPYTAPHQRPQCGS